MVNIIDSKKMNNFVIWWTEVSFLLPKSKVNRFEIMPDRTVFLLTELSFFLDETEVSFNVLFFSSKGNFFRRLFFAISFFLWPFNHMASFSSKSQFSLECFHLKNCTPQSFEWAPLTVLKCSPQILAWGDHQYALFCGLGGGALPVHFCGLAVLT